MGFVNVAIQVEIERDLLEWALKAYRKHQRGVKTYSRDVRRELAMLWIWKGGELCFEDTDITVGLVEDDGSFRLEDVTWDSYLQEWTGLGVVHAAWGDRDESTAVPICVVVP